MSKAQKQAIMTIINNRQWCTRLRRKQQYYGIKYFQTKIQDQVLQPFYSNDHYPLEQLQDIIDKTVKKFNIFEQNDPPNQILVNRYVKKDVLGLHVQDINAFGKIIAGISFGSTDYLRLMNVQDKSKQYFLELEDCSCYVLSGEARFKYRHGIARTINKEMYKTQDFQRISLTVRHVIDSRRKIKQSSQIEEIKHQNMR